MEREPDILEVTTESLESEPYVSSTSCEHAMADNGDGTASCSKGCGHGCAFDADSQEISGGKVADRT